MNQSINQNENVSQSFTENWLEEPGHDFKLAIRLIFAKYHHAVKQHIAHEVVFFLSFLSVSDSLLYVIL